MGGCWSTEEPTDGEEPWPNKIRRWPKEGSSEASPKDVELPPTHPRFGHLYGRDDANKVLKVRAWEHLVRVTAMPNTAEQQPQDPVNPDKAAAIKNIYIVAVEDVLDQARSEYVTKPPSPQSEFVNMLIEDGCLFLQLALLILGHANTLCYPPGDPVFGQTEKKKWIEAMFFVGNQIPLVVLKKLMEQQFFKAIASNIQNSTPTPSTLCERALYELLFLTKEGTQGPTQQASDILHVLKIMLITDSSPNTRVTCSHSSGTDQVNDEDIPDYIMSRDDGNERDKFGLWAMRLKRHSICIKKVEGGIKGIHFKSCILWAHLFLPVFLVDNTTEIILKNLILYEKQRLRYQPAEVSSYIRFMSKLVQTREDARFLFRNNVVVGDPSNVDKLPGILESLASEGGTRFTSQLRMVTNQIGGYIRSQKWISGLLTLTVLVLVLTAIQTYYTIAEYYKKS